MNVTAMLIVVFAVMVVALVATFMVGLSKGNQQEDPGYMQKTGAKWLRLMLLYAVATIAIVAVFIALVR